MKEALISNSQLPEFWQMLHSRTHNRIYYFNTKTSESRWEPPEPIKHRFEQGRHASAPRHILIKHKYSEDPTNWKKDKIIRTKSEALEMAKNIRELLVHNRAKFEEVAAKDSDCISAVHGGIMHLKRGTMSKAFDCIAFMLRIGEISPLILTPSGVHIICREVE
ncbi:FKBP-like protein [Basidiobolus meristosporus CBS 931.73]|uniref:Peptidyl-prolyl cis-trans isomerase n=1 Tax=Basidiobolus meristosporus CBS 931.73 TaxID=1314790 RepID=A0A1Y1ZBR6_9FUNG|nr:FKBP-like protein [Basidiobolus meristosporus CBS 931.73]|eukprot:ORY07731.1 FKBP-like protein [Basidiobolus meristosporus CBS 931.73]